MTSMSCSPSSCWPSWSAAVRINNSSLWTHLKTGELIVAAGGSRSFRIRSRYTETGQRWVNIPWLFQWSHAARLQAGAGPRVPADPDDPTANQASAEQIADRRPDRSQCPGAADHGLDPPEDPPTGAGAVVVGRLRDPRPGGDRRAGLDCVRGDRRTGRWSAPQTWGLLLLAIEMLLLHRAYNEGRRGALYGLVPLFLLWANLDESFFAGAADPGRGGHRPGPRRAVAESVDPARSSSVHGDRDGPTVKAGSA